MEEFLSHRLHHDDMKPTELDTSEHLLAISRRGCAIDFKNGKSLRLRRGTVLANRDLITFPKTETRGSMSRDVAVALLKSLVLADPMQVIPSHDDGLLHLSGDDDATK